MERLTDEYELQLTSDVLQKEERRKSKSRKTDRKGEGEIRREYDSETETGDATPKILDIVEGMLLKNNINSSFFN